MHYPRVHPVHPGARYTVYSAPAGQSGGVNSAVGLISVGVRTLSAHILDLRTITEVYNLVEVEDR